MEWWLSKGRSAADLPDDVICAYARLMWQWCKDRGLLDKQASDFLQRAVESLLDGLPPEHRRAANAIM